MSLTTADRQYIELRIRNDAPNIAVAYVLWAVLGILSAHRFYLGRPRSAVFQIISYPVIYGVSWLAISVALSVGLIYYEPMIYFAVLFAAAWWLIDAALISGIVRDHKDAMREQLTREVASGNISTTQASIRDISPEKPPVQKVSPAKAVTLQAAAEKPAAKAAVAAAAPAPAPQAAPAAPEIVKAPRDPEVSKPSIMDAPWTPASASAVSVADHGEPAAPPQEPAEAAAPADAAWTPATDTARAEEPPAPPVMLPYPHRPLPDQ